MTLLLGTVSRAGPGSTTLTIRLDVFPTTRLLMFELDVWRRLVMHRGIERLRDSRVLLDRDLICFMDTPGQWWPTAPNGNTSRMRTK